MFCKNMCMKFVRNGKLGAVDLHHSAIKVKNNTVRGILRPCFLYYDVNDYCM